MIGVGVVGYGYWGPNLARNFADIDGWRLDAVCDAAEGRRILAQRRHPTARICSTLREVIDDSSVSAVAIATPVATHFELALACLKADKHVLVEKPLAATSTEALALCEEADRRGLTLIVDHTFLYTPAVRKLRELVDRDELGRLLYYDAVRVNLGVFQSDVNVLWDLAVHDISIMDHLLPSKPIAVSATGVAHLRDQPANLAYLTFFYSGQLLAHVHVNWLAPVKLRRILLGGDKKMAIYDDVEASEKVKIYDRGLDVPPDAEATHRLLVNYRMGDMYAPHLETTEALRVELKHFRDCIRDGRAPLSDGSAGLRTVEYLEAATASMVERGRPVELGTAS
jgi:predicted dehydrogenase